MALLICLVLVLCGVVMYTKGSGSAVTLGLWTFGIALYWTLFLICSGHLSPLTFHTVI